MYKVKTFYKFQNLKFFWAYHKTEMYNNLLSVWLAGRLKFSRTMICHCLKTQCKHQTRPSKPVAVNYFTSEVAMLLCSPCSELGIDGWSVPSSYTYTAETMVSYDLLKRSSADVSHALGVNRTTLLSGWSIVLARICPRTVLMHNARVTNN